MKFKVFFSSIVWGEEYIYYFLKYTINSLLKKGNLNCEKISKDSVYVIYCKKNEAHLIKNNKIIKRLKSKIKLKIEYMNIQFDKDKYLNTGYFQKKLFDYAQTNQFEIFMHIYPDSIASKNYVKFCLERHELKYEAVLSPAPLIISEDVKKIDDLSLLDNIYKNLHNFYQSFKIINPRNPICILETRKNLFLLCKHLNINSIKIFKENKINKINSFDEDVLKKLETKKNKIFYAKSNYDFFLVSIESKYSERSIKNLTPYIVKQNIYDINNYLKKNNNIYEKNNFLNGIYVFSKIKSKKRLKIIYSKFKKKIHLIINFKKKNNNLTKQETEFKFFLKKYIKKFKKQSGLKFYIFLIYFLLPITLKKIAILYYKKLFINLYMVENKSNFSLIEFYLLNKKITIFDLIRN